MKSLEGLLLCVLADAGTQCGVSTTRDSKTITRRIKEEGQGFPTLTLPAFCDDFERCLHDGLVDSTRFKAFKKRACLPAFLQGFTSRVFDADTGRLLSDPDINCILAVRQVCNLLRKVELPCSEKRKRAAVDQYIECDNQVASLNLSENLLSQFRRVGSLLFDEILSTGDVKVTRCELVPKHGPGATADKLKGNHKFTNRVWTERLESYFPAGEYLFSSARHYFNAVEDNEVTWLEPGSELPVKVTLVPKTLKTPRVIAIEPSYVQYVQQGLMEYLVSSLESDDFQFKGLIGFTDQEPNRALARLGSKTGEYATLDLSEASDRVSTVHVDNLIKYYPHLLGAVNACRSSKALLPDGRVIPLSKYASMGSALTFPLEAMVFATVVFCGIESRLNHQLSKKVIKDLLPHVRVYGDDIIVPNHYAPTVSSALEAFGLKVNRHKSFWNGKFRESCGGEFYDGSDVSYVKVRRLLPKTRHCTQEIVSSASLRNQLYQAGFWKSANYVERHLTRFIPFPTTHRDSPGLGRHSNIFHQEDKLCPYLQRPLVKAAVVCGSVPSSKIDGHDALLKFFLKRGSEPIHDERHLERSGRPEHVTLKLRWVPPF